MGRRSVGQEAGGGRRESERALFGGGAVVAPAFKMGCWRSGRCGAGTQQPVDRAACCRPADGVAGEEETDEHLAAFGDVLASICGERSERAISRLSWTDVHGAADPRSLVRHHQAAGVSGPATEEYRAHIGKVAGTAADHRVFVTVTVDRSALKVHASRTTTRSVSAKDLMTVIVDEGLALARELDQRGFTVGRPLSPLGLVAADPPAR